jgi:hypothetical protein
MRAMMFSSRSGLGAFSRRVVDQRHHIILSTMALGKRESNRFNVQEERKLP